MKRIPYTLIGIVILVVISLVWFGFALYTWLYKTSITYRISSDGNLEIVASSTNGEYGVLLDTLPLSSKENIPIISGRVVRAKNLVLPKGVDSLPDGRLIVAERGGEIYTIALDGVASRVLHTITPVVYGEAGILALAVDPDFVNNNTIYITYSYKNQAGELFNRVSRFTLASVVSTTTTEMIASTSVARAFQSAVMRDETVLIDRIPAGVINNGGMLAIDPDGYLWVATGDAGKGVLSQDDTSLGGKLLRIRRDGSIPALNLRPDSPIVARGLRAPVGLVWNTVTGGGFVLDKGNTTTDRLYTVRVGANYGWPVTASCQTGDARFVDALVCSGNASWRPSGLAILTGGATSTIDTMIMSTDAPGALKVFTIPRLLATSTEIITKNLVLPGLSRLGGVSVLSGKVPIVWTATKDGRSGGLVDDDIVASFDLQ